MAKNNESSPPYREWTEQEKKLFEWLKTPEARIAFEKNIKNNEVLKKMIENMSNISREQLETPYGTRRKRVSSLSFFGI